MNPIFDKIEPVKLLAISVSNYSNGCLELIAPLQPNINDKGSAFAGSISSMLVLSGWGVVTLYLDEVEIQAEVMAVESSTRYFNPARGELKCVAKLSDATLLVADLQTKKRGRIQIESNLYSGAEHCATMSTSYAVFIKTDSGSEN